MIIEGPIEDKLNSDNGLLIVRRFPDGDEPYQVQFAWGESQTGRGDWTGGAVASAASVSEAIGLVSLQVQNA
jgi:hypothetical protein